MFQYCWLSSILEYKILFRVLFLNYLKCIQYEKKNIIFKIVLRTNAYQVGLIFVKTESNHKLNHVPSICPKFKVCLKVRVEWVILIKKKKKDLNTIDFLKLPSKWYLKNKFRVLLNFPKINYLIFQHGKWNDFDNWQMTKVVLAM